jgi:hypothetical protein
MLGCVSAYIPFKTISYLKLQRSYKALRNKLVLPSAMTNAKVCYRECALSVDANMNQIPIRNIISLALDVWIPMNKLAITLFIAY